jgi:hypothetical protein
MSRRPPPPPPRGGGDLRRDYASTYSGRSATRGDPVPVPCLNTAPADPRGALVGSPRPRAAIHHPDAGRRRRDRRGRGALGADFDDPDFESVMVEIRAARRPTCSGVGGAEITAAWGSGGGAERADLMMGWDEVRAMAASGSWRSAPTRSPTATSRARRPTSCVELDESRAAIERATGARAFFAYPYGRWGADYNDTVARPSRRPLRCRLHRRFRDGRTGRPPVRDPRISECADRWRGPAGTFSAPSSTPTSPACAASTRRVPPGSAARGAPRRSSLSAPPIPGPRPAPMDAPAPRVGPRRHLTRRRRPATGRRTNTRPGSAVGRPRPTRATRPSARTSRTGGADVGAVLHLLVARDVRQTSSQARQSSAQAAQVTAWKGEPRSMKFALTWQSSAQSRSTPTTFTSAYSPPFTSACCAVMCTRRGS